MTSKPVGEFVEVSKLTLHPKNPRDNDSAVDDISRSIARFGFTSPIIANRENVVLCGNTRLKASRKLGLSVVPVVYVDLSPTEQELLMIADNKLGELSKWNTESLSRMLSELDANGEDLSGLGFGDDELSRILDSILENDDSPFEDDSESHPDDKELCPYCGK
jgi:ParB-like chromosome segregation protein Spo0J